MVLIITDPPDEAEEATGLPLGGSESAAGSLLNAMLEAAGWMTGIPSCGVFVTPVTKCKVPAGYKLTNTELSACRRYLAQQITLLQPQLIFTLGRVAAQALLAPMQEGHSARPLGQLRGMVHEVQGHAWVASLAPQYLLRNPLEKAKAWDDLCLAMAHLANTKINR
jgi:DNA polymerase